MRHLEAGAVEGEMRKWVGDVHQLPPMVSAIKKDGVALYKMARKGQEVEREPRLLHIYEFALLRFEERPRLVSHPLLQGHLCAHPVPRRGRRPGLRRPHAHPATHPLR
jgi:tRNA U55 pseudouridine synthase TruB